MLALEESAEEEFAKNKKATKETRQIKPPTKEKIL